MSNVAAYISSLEQSHSADELAHLKTRLNAFLEWQQTYEHEDLSNEDLLSAYQDSLDESDKKASEALNAVAAFLDWLGALSGPVAEAGEYVVGIGASAGGLEALERFFGSDDIDSRLSYVVVQHLSPDFKSMMPQILSRVTQIPMQSIEDGMLLEPGNIYLNNPRTDVRLKDGYFEQKDAPTEHTLHLPINTFFKSLAQAKKNRAIGIVLSGTGRDGSEGVAEIHAKGGLVLTQDTRSALFGSMPENAAARGPTHFILSPSEMPSVIQDYILQGAPPQRLDPLDTVTLTSENAFSYLLSLLQRAFGIDFSLYKNATLERRVERRMSLGGEHNLERYVARLQTDPDELDALYRDMLVDVTQFFRDKEAFEFLRKDVVPKMVLQKEEGSTLRVWSAACASGEEAYSLAMVFEDEIERQNKDIELKMFATDAHKDSVMRAGTGSFEAKAFANVPTDLRDRYFLSENDGRYKVRKRLRQKIIFAPHDLLSDGSFSNLDFISCRNMLIYLRPEAQVRALTHFTNGLNKSGILFLGSSEHLGKLREHYAVLSEKWRIYQKLGNVTINPIALSPTPIIQGIRAGAKRHSSDEWERNLLKKLVPAGYVVDAQGHLVEVLGDAHRYLRLRSGRVNLNLSAMLDEPLATSIKSGLFTVQRTSEQLELSLVELREENGSSFAKVNITPFESDLHDRGSRHYLVQITETDRDLASPSSVDGEAQPEAAVDRLTGLERELEFTRESLQASLEEVETTNEELQSTNEELIASNEELQSTNEELSSVNEELITVNAEFQSQNKRLNQINSDLENLMRNTETIAVFLDAELKLRMITPAAFEIFGLVETDVGRVITQFAPFLSFGRGMITELAQKALEGERHLRTVTLDPSLVDRQDDAHDIRFQLSVMPYTTVDNEVDGVVLRFVDITEAERQVSRPLQERVRLAESIRSAAPALMYIYSAEDDKNIYASNDVYELLGYSSEDIQAFDTGMLEKLMHPDDFTNFAQHRKTLEESAKGEMVSFDYRMKSAGGEWVWLRSYDAVYELRKDGKIKSVIGYVTNIGNEKSLNRYSAYTSAMFESNPDCLQLIDENGRIFGMNNNGCELLDVDDFESINSLPWRDLWTNKDQIDRILQEAKEEGSTRFRAESPTQKGRLKTWDVHVTRIDAPENGGYFFLSSSREAKELSNQ